MFWIYRLSILFIVFTFSIIVSTRNRVGLITGLGTVVKRAVIFFIYSRGAGIRPKRRQ